MLIDLKKLYALFIVLGTFLSACSWFQNRPEIADVLAVHFKNKLYHQFDTTAYHAVFNEELRLFRDSLSHPKVITAFYESQGFQPSLVTRFFANGQLDSLRMSIKESHQDGFNPEIFRYSQLGVLLETFREQPFKKIEEVYPLIARLELKTADALLNYTNFFQYGSVNPRKLFRRYYMPNLRPDSSTMDSLLRLNDLPALLKAVQPQSRQYLALKEQLKHYRHRLKTEAHPDIQKIKLNMERMRWKVPLQEEELVMVNIPDFTLTWLKGEDTLTTMKVCVGSRREAAYEEKITTYLKSRRLDDKPKNHETPQLLSVFTAIQVNPVWNIPVSIAQSEIYYQAIKDRYYLSNNNIHVYYKDKKVADPDTIQWNRYSREKLPFKFKQASGDRNALGKFKFVFDNGSSIYLHDTNNKNGFRLANRAISHGCVRVEDPLKFAELLVRDQGQYDRLRMEVSLPPLDTTRMEQFLKKQAKKIDTIKRFNLQPSWFNARKGIGVAIYYHTAWVHNGTVQFRPDVYDYDPILWEALKKYL